MYKLVDLRKALMVYKKNKQFSGSPSKMTKTQIVDALKTLNFSFHSLPGYGAGVKPQAKRTVPFGPEPKPKRTRKPKGTATLPEFGPKLKAGMSYKKLASDYAKNGNVQLNAMIPAVPAVAVVKRRGRPRKNVAEPSPGAGLKFGLSYKKLASAYKKHGNVQLEEAMKRVKTKRD